MTNKERYQRTFSALHASDDFVMEVTQMKRKVNKKRLIAICAAAMLILGLASVAYATDIGGIQRTVQLWLRGDQTDAVLEVENGTYSVTYEDENGNVKEMGGGGIVTDIFGNERPLTEEEIIAHLNEPDVDYKDDGSVWVYYLDQQIEITDKFDNDGICYVQLKNGDKTLYLTIKYNDGYAMSPHGYESPDCFN